MFTLHFNTTGSAFDDDSDGDFTAETARLLREVADKIEQGSIRGILIDVNGNSVGRWDAATDQMQAD